VITTTLQKLTCIDLHIHHYSATSPPHIILCFYTCITAFPFNCISSVSSLIPHYTIKSIYIYQYQMSLIPTMDQDLREYKHNLENLHSIKHKIQCFLLLDYDLTCLETQESLEYIHRELVKTYIHEHTEPSTLLTIDAEMIINIYRSIDLENRKKLILLIEDALLHFKKTKTSMNTLRSSFKNLHNLLQEDLFFKFMAEIETISSLMESTPSDIKKCGAKKYGYPLLLQHSLVFLATLTNQEKMLRKICCKVALAVKFDICKSNFQTDFYKQMQDILSNLEHVPQKDESPLSIPLARKVTKRGGLKTRQRRQGRMQHKKKKITSINGTDHPSGDID